MGSWRAGGRQRDQVECGGGRGAEAGARPMRVCPWQTGGAVVPAGPEHARPRLLGNPGLALPGEPRGWQRSARTWGRGPGGMVALDPGPGKPHGACGAGRGGFPGLRGLKRGAGRVALGPGRACLLGPGPQWAGPEAPRYDPRLLLARGLVRGHRRSGSPDVGPHASSGRGAQVSAVAARRGVSSFLILGFYLPDSLLLCVILAGKLQ